MLTFPVGQDVSVTIPILDLNGDPITPTGLAYQVLDENETILVQLTPLTFDPSDTEASITVLAAVNGLPDTEPRQLNTIPLTVTRGMRVVRLFIATAAGAFQQEAVYRLRKPQVLVPLQNSFMSYYKAQLVAEDLLAMDGWNDADQDARINALTEAYRRITRFGFRVKWPENVDAQNYIHFRMVNVITPQMWPMMDAELWSLYPDVFKIALNRGQLTEANHILRSDPVAAKRAGGILSESIGESSMMFRSGRPLERELCKETFQQLTPYIDYKFTLTRS